MLAIYLFARRETTLETLRQRLVGHFDVSTIRDREFFVEPRSEEWIRVGDLEEWDFDIPERLAELMPRESAPRCFEVQHHGLTLLHRVLSLVVDDSMVFDDEYGNVERGEAFRQDVKGRLDRYWRALQIGDTKSGKNAF